MGAERGTEGGCTSWAGWRQQWPAGVASTVASRPAGWEREQAPHLSPNRYGPSPSKVAKAASSSATMASRSAPEWRAMPCMPGERQACMWPCTSLPGSVTHAAHMQPWALASNQRPCLLLGAHEAGLASHARHHRPHRPRQAVRAQHLVPAPPPALQSVIRAGRRLWCSSSTSQCCRQNLSGPHLIIHPALVHDGGRQVCVAHTGHRHSRGPGLGVGRVQQRCRGCTRAAARGRRFRQSRVAPTDLVAARLCKCELLGTAATHSLPLPWPSHLTRCWMMK